MASTPRTHAGDIEASGALSRALGASIVLGPVRRICLDSVICRWGLRALQMLSGSASWIAQHLLRRPPADVSSRIATLASDSLVFGGLDRLLAQTPEVWAASATRRQFAVVLGPLETWQRVRVVGTAVIVAALTHGVLNLAVLRENGYRLAVGLATLALGSALIGASRPVATAWRHWR